MNLTDKDIKRFWSHVNIKSENECWEWKKAIVKGYGKFKLKRKMYQANRISYLLTYGEIPEGLIICHKCNNSKCCNPNHLYAGTNKDNTQDIINAGNFRGNLGGVKLNIDQVIEIRDLLSQGIKSVDIARKYSVSEANISDIKLNKIWRSTIWQK